jgi:tetratricopeptide (TPR) repeat protein
MRHSLTALRFLLLSSFAFMPVFAQAPAATPAGSPAKTEESSLAAEPYVIELIQSKVRFEPDGKGERDLQLRIRVQSESAIREFGVLVYAYSASFENLDVLYARVRKPDGSIVETPAGDIQELDSAVSREAPMYTDQREKHIAVKSLGVGDILEASLRWTVHDPVAPGHFWFDHNFFKAGICLKEELEVNVPANLAVKLSGSNPSPLIREQDGRRIYTFTTSHLKKEEEEGIPAWEKDFDGATPPSVQLSSFSSWAEVGTWFGGLQQPGVKVTPEIRAKADELTKGKFTDAEKIPPIYDFVASRFRYIGVDLGAGRYTPHSAEAVLANRYGDCKDKHTLFAALLQAAGIQAFPALISSTYKLDADMPSANLFDHVITAIPQGDSFLFLDTTPEVAPFGLLLAQLRNRQALVIPSNGMAKLVRTPADPPFPNWEKYKMDSSIDSSGVLDGKARFEDRGDAEVLIRLAYRNTAQNRWNELAQNFVQRLGFGGTVSEVAAAQPESTSDPFWFSYSYHRPDYSEWKQHRISLPFPIILLSELTEKQKASQVPLPLGSPQEVIYEASLKLPVGFSAILPKNTDQKTDFAEYSATYSLENGVLHGTRHLKTKQREIPGSERAAFSAFVKSVEDDENRYILLRGEFESDNPFAKSQSLLKQGKTSEAIALLEKALQDNPDNILLKLTLGGAYLRVPDETKAMALFNQMVEGKPDSGMLNGVAYELARANLRISDALNFASRAVAGISADTMDLTTDPPGPLDYVRTRALAADWDTLGWAKFRAGDTASAEKYVQAAWLLFQHAGIGEHLIEIYEKLGKQQDAARICHMALAAYGKDDDPDTRNKLQAAEDRLGVSKSDSVTLNAKAYKPTAYGGVELSEMRSVKISFPAELPAQSKSATFAITIVNGQKTALVKFIEGDEGLRPAVKTLVTAKYPQAFPDNTPVKLVLQGLLSCSKFSKGCMLVFFPMETIAAPSPSPFQ